MILDVTLFRDFKEDNRRSMEIYADRLAQGLRQLGGDQLRLNEVIPRESISIRMLPDWAGLRTRLRRYVDYPRQARKLQSTINHIIEDGYAHLLGRIDPARTIVTVHDVMPILRWRGAIEGLSYPHRPRIAEYSTGFLRRAGMVIAMSETTKRDLIEHCGCSETAVRVSYQGIDEVFRPAASAERNELRQRLGLPLDEANVVLIMGHQAYKNHGLALRVVETVEARYGRPIQLVRLGRHTREWEQLRSEARLQRPIREMSDVSLNQLRDLYACADCVLFPSLYEGFGRPPLEAMACDTPVVSSSGGALPEVLGDAALKGDPNDVRTLADSLATILFDESCRSEMIRRGRKRAAMYRWDRHAEEVLHAYQALRACQWEYA